MDAMQEPRAQRTLVKSPPELWAEVSDIDALARHLGEFGEIRITRLDPETTVAWEGDRACGTVALEPSGWGTKVTITAKLAGGASRRSPSCVGAREPGARAASPPSRSRTRRAGAGAGPAEPEPRARGPRPRGRGTEGGLLRPPVRAPAQGGGRGGGRARARSRPRSSRSVEPEPEPEPVATEPEPEPVAVEPDPEPVVAEPQPVPLDAERAEANLTGVLDDLGSAHHRPFSRS